MKVILNTGSTINQGAVIKGGKKMTPQYKEEAALCMLNPGDFKKLWFEKGSFLEKVRVKTEAGSVTVYARQDEGLKEGQAFIPRGIWSNMVISSETFDSGSPFYKGMEAEVEGTDGEVLDCKELIKKIKKGYKNG